jgi:predicted restriction endonuclease
MKETLCKGGLLYKTEDTCDVRLISLNIYLINRKPDKNDSELYKIIEDANLNTSCYSIIAQNLANKINAEHGRELFEYVDEVIQLIDMLYYTFGNPDSRENILNNIIRKRQLRSKADSLADKYIKRNIKTRPNQDVYRNDLLRIHKTCQLCGIINKDILRASHIKPYAKCEDDECFDFYNGFLLCATHDLLFDKGLISFDNEGIMLISKNLKKSDIEKLNITGKQIELYDEQKYYLNYHRKYVFQK